MKLGSIAPLCLCAVALTACGGGRGDDEAAIERMLVASAKSRDPADCTRYLTMHYLEQMTKLKGRAALEACEEQALDPLVEAPSRVVVSRVDAGGGSATATVAFTDSVFDAQTVRFALVERDGRWKLHQILGFVDLKAERLVTEVGRELMRELTTPGEAEAGACVVGLLDGMGDRELERLILETTTDRILALLETCVSRSSPL